MKQRIDELVKIIEEADYNYHVLDKPEITDQEYDKYLRELIELENEYPEYKHDNSPTSKVGSVILDKFNKVEHTIPMMSLSNVYNEEEIREFDNRIKKKVNNPKYVVELKIDGISGCLEYVDGVLKRASTRGDGLVGEDITNNVKTIKSIPLKLRKKVDIEIRGELFMPYASFNKINEDREKNGVELLANTRNAAAGSLRQLDSKVAASRKLDAFLYQVVGNSELKSHHEALELITDLGLKVNPNIKLVDNIDGVLEYIEYWSDHRDDLGYEIDGIVIKLDDMTKYESVGKTAKSPNWATAYKFPAKEAYTKLKDIVFTVGRTGQITPNAILEPVIVAGSKISKTTLHNEDFVYEKGIKIGDIVSIKKAGDVIPEVVSFLEERRNGSERDFKMISHCPICGTKLTKKDSLTFCLNENCEARKIENLIHFVSRDAMYIEGLGERIIEDFYNFGYLKNIIDIYNLKDHVKELKNLEGFGEKSVEKLLTSIENSKTNSLERLLFGLGIRHVGKVVSKILAKHYDNIDNLMNASEEEIASVDNIGLIIAKSVHNYFTNEDNIDIINKIKEYGINTTYISETEIENELFKDKTFVLTGSLTLPRNEVKEKIEINGGKVTSSVTSKTDVVIVGANPGSKYEKAKKLNITIWDEEEYKDKIKE